MNRRLSRSFAITVAFAALSSCVALAIAAGGSQPQSQASTSCQPLPVNGARFMLGNPPVPLSNQVQPLVTVFNQHAYPTVVIFASPDRAKRYQAVVVYPGADARVALPTGSYGLIVLVGRTWCDINRGFSDGKTINVTGALPVASGGAPSVTLQSSGTADADFTVAYDSRPARDAAEANRSESAPAAQKMELRRHDGHFFASGSLNGFPVVYLVDTGASITSVSRRTADSAGIRDCTRAEFRTGNGSVEGCVATVRELSFGDFRMRNVDIAIMPKLAGPALLGMNVLRHYRIEQQENSMRIWAK
jgi:clan AA aspartic protease (TIGR02281 family)